MDISFQALLDSLPIMGWGMLGIFIVIGIMMACVIALDKLFPPKKD